MLSQAPEAQDLLWELRSSGKLFLGFLPQGESMVGYHIQEGLRQPGKFLAPLDLKGLLSQHVTQLSLRTTREEGERTGSIQGCLVHCPMESVSDPFISRDFMVGLGFLELAVTS